MAMGEIDVSADLRQAAKDYLVRYGGDSFPNQFRAANGAGSVSMASDRKGYGVPVPGVFVIPEPNAYRPYIPGVTDEQSALMTLEVALKMFDMQSAGRGAAIIVEPVISAGGVLVPTKSFMHALRAAADARGMLLIFDEAQTAFGRIGTKTGSAFFGVVPDIMTMCRTLA